jgi:hypothetical protein
LVNGHQNNTIRAADRSTAFGRDVEGEDLSAVGITNDPEWRSLVWSSAGDGIECRDGDDMGTDGVSKGLGGGYPNAQTGEGTGTDGDCDQVNLPRLPRGLIEQLGE